MKKRQNYFFSLCINPYLVTQERNNLQMLTKKTLRPLPRHQERAISCHTKRSSLCTVYTAAAATHSMSQLPPSICSSLLPFYPPTQPELKVTAPFLPPSTLRIPLPPFPQGDFKPWTSMEKGREGEQENPDTSQQENKQSGRVQRETCAAPKIDENQLLYFQGE